jgi:hypothetical protein
VAAVFGHGVGFPADLMGGIREQDKNVHEKIFPSHRTGKYHWLEFVFFLAFLEVNRGERVNNVAVQSPSTWTPVLLVSAGIAT